MSVFVKIAVAFFLVTWVVALAFTLFRTDDGDESRPWLRFGLSSKDALMHAGVAVLVLIGVRYGLAFPLVPVVTLAGFVLFGGSVIVHGLRTGTKYTWESIRYPMTRGERLAVLYGVILALGSLSAV